MYEALSRASVVIEVIEDVEQYEATLVSTNGVILQPYDTSTTLVGSVLKNKIDVTNKIKDLRWSKWNPTEDNLIECPDWNNSHKGVNIIEAEACPDHIHMLIEIPPKMNVSGFMGYLKRKSALLIFQKLGNMKFSYRNREFWYKGYYVDTVGRNKKAIAEYIRNQLQEDMMYV